MTLKTRIASGLALGAAATGLALAGTGTASAQPYEIANGHYAAHTSVGSPTDPLRTVGPQIDLGEVTITDKTISINGQTGVLHRTPDADYSAAVATVPGYGRVVLVGSDELVLGPGADGPAGGVAVWLTPIK